MTAKQNFFIDLFHTDGTVELIVDNPKSHCSRSVTASTADISESSFSLTSLSFKEDPPFALISFMGDQPRQRFHNSFPPRGRAMAEEEESALLGAWMSCSDSDMDYRFPSFDTMLTEKSSATESAVQNVARPTRRRSLTEVSSNMLDQPEESRLLPQKTIQDKT